MYVARALVNVDDPIIVQQGSLPARVGLPPVNNGLDVVRLDIEELHCDDWLLDRRIILFARHFEHFLSQRFDGFQNDAGIRVDTGHSDFPQSLSLSPDIKDK